MSLEATIFMQALTLTLTVISIIWIVYLTNVQSLHWGMYLLPALLLINLGMFLSERLLEKVFVVDFGLSPATINSWAVCIQLQIPLTGVALLGVYSLNKKKNGTL